MTLVAAQTAAKKLFKPLQSDCANCCKTVQNLLQNHPKSAGKTTQNPFRLASLTANEK